MKIPLPTSLAEIAHKLRFPTDPRNFLRIINLAPPGNWAFSLAFGDRYCLSIKPPSSVDAAGLLALAPLDMFRCEALVLEQTGKRLICNLRSQVAAGGRGNELLFEEDAEASADANEIVLLDCLEGVVPPELTSATDLREFLLDRTWMGSDALTKGRYSVDLKVGAWSSRFSNESQSDSLLLVRRQEGRPTVRIQFGVGQPLLGELRFSSVLGMEERRFRWSHSGLIDEAEFALFFGCKRSELLLRGETEISFPARELAPDGTLALDANCRQLLNDATRLLRELPRHRDFSKFEMDVRRYEQVAAARRIDERKTQLLSCRYVYFGQRLVYKEPTNENETVALHQKLEGMGGLPFPAFSSLEYTPKLGIDAIVNFRLEEAEPDRRLATVEFEFDLRSYFAHGHPAEQTDLIVCWRAPAVLPQGEYRVDPRRPWLGHVHIGTKSIPVACISKYPNITLRMFNS